MNGEVYVEWLRQQGHAVVRSESAVWHSEGFGVYQAIPYHRLICPSREELDSFFSRYRASFLRYFTAPEGEGAATGYQVIFDDPRGYGFDRLGHRTRKNVRRALRDCRVQPISLPELANAGWPIRLETFQRQRRVVHEPESAWKKKLLLANELPGFEAHAAFVEGQLAAYLLALRMDECYYILEQDSSSRFLAVMVNNALSFEVTRELSTRPGVQMVCYGACSLDAPPSVDEFKFHMGYRSKPVGQAVAVHPLVSPWMNRLTLGALQMANRLLPGNRRLRKAEGLVRICLRKPLAAVSAQIHETAG